MVGTRERRGDVKKIEVKGERRSGGQNEAVIVPR